LRSSSFSFQHDMIEPPSRIKGTAFCAVKSAARAFRLKVLYTVAQGISVQAAWGANRQQLIGVVEIALRQWLS
jgi:hypothetical protein